MEPPVAEDSVTDLYGFDLGAVCGPAALAVRLACDGAALRVALRAWAPYVQDGRLPSSESKLKDMIRQGVPPTLRAWVWAEASGAAARRAAVPASYYSGMALAGESASPHLKNIQQDVKAAFPSHPWLQSAEGQAAAARVLAAFSVHNPAVGYSRPLSHIVSLLLVALNRNQESAFWLLVQTVEKLLFPGTYSHNLVGCQVEMKALEDLLSSKLPRLAAHMRALEADVGIIATEWYLSLFASSLPSETTARVWDALFHEGPKVLFRVALALLSMHQDQLLAFDNAGEMIMYMRRAAPEVHDRDLLMSTAFEGLGSLPMAVIDRYRAGGSREVAAELAGRKSSQGQSQEDELHAIRDKAGMLGAVAASGVKKGFGALVSAAKKVGGGERRGTGGGGVPAGAAE